MKLFLAATLLAALGLHSASAVEGDNCSLTFRQPQQARYLKFCQDYNSRACCIPGHDLENQIQFENLIAGLGPGCKNPMMYPEVRYFYCLGCDPNQPKYTYTPTSGANSGKETIKICKSFLDRLWRDPAYEECGVMISNDCPSHWGDNGFDPYACGDDLILPKHDYPTALDFIQAFKPPGLEQEFEEVDDTTGASVECWSAPAFSSAGRLAGSSTLATVAIMAVGAALRSWL